MAQCHLSLFPTTTFTSLGSQSTMPKITFDCFGASDEQMRHVLVGITCTAIIFALLVLMGDCASKGWC